MRQYKVGDRVQIVDCAHPIWEPQDEAPGWQRRDMSPELVGVVATIEHMSDTEEQNIGRGKALRFDDGGYRAWFYDWQLKLVEKAEYRVLLNFCKYVASKNLYASTYDNNQIDTVINNFLNEQDGDRNNDS